jgi:hypothetical protein
LLAVDALTEVSFDNSFIHFFEQEANHFLTIGGKTTTSQLFPFKNGDTNIILTPASATNQTCLIAGADRVEAANCDSQKDQVFQLAEIV